MTYGEFLRACRKLANIENKSEFSRLLGMKDPDHYIGAENDTPGKKPGRELLEAAAKLAGFEFEECILLPSKDRPKRTKEQESLHRKLQELLEAGGNGAAWISGNIETFHETHVRRRRKGLRK